MSSLRKLVFAVIFGSLIMFAAMIYLPSAKAIWIRHSGAVIPNGSSSLRYTNKPFRILSVKGQRWVDNRLLEASAYHVLVIFPVVIPEDNYSSSGGDGLTHTDTQKWLVPGRSASDQSFEEKDLTIAYDAIWQTITYDARSYHLTNGNLFVIRFDQNWQPAVTQLKVTMNTNGDVQEEIDAFKSALKDDQMVQQL